MSKQDKILELLQKMDNRLSALESGKRTKKSDNGKTPLEELCQKVKQDLTKKELVSLKDYGSGAILRWARDSLSKDPSLRVIYQDGESFVVKEKSAKKVVIVQKTAPELASLPVTGRGRGQKRAGYIAKIKAELDKGKTMTNKGICRLTGKTTQTANDIMDIIAKMDGYQVIKVGSKHRRVASRIGTGGGKSSEPKLAHHEPPMHRKTAYNKFMGEKLYYYQKKMGMNAKDAFNASVADWNKSKGAGVSTARTFPDFRSVRSELKPIIIGILERLAKRGVGIDYKGISYALDIKSEKEYQRFIEEVIEHWDEIKAYFGVSANLKWNGAVLKLNG